jgi:hypothetical protein
VDAVLTDGVVTLRPPGPGDGRLTGYTVATLVIHPENERSLAVARRAGFTRSGEVNGEPFFTREL